MTANVYRILHPGSVANQESQTDTDWVAEHNWIEAADAPSRGAIHKISFKMTAQTEFCFRVQRGQFLQSGSFA